MKSAPVVAHIERDLLWPVIQLRGQAFSPRMLLHIMDGFLRNAQNFLLGARRQWPVSTEDAELGIEFSALRALYHAPQLHRQSRLARVLRTQRPDRLPRIGQSFAHVV